MICRSSGLIRFGQLVLHRSRDADGAPSKADFISVYGLGLERKTKKSTPLSILIAGIGTLCRWEVGVSIYVAAVLLRAEMDLVEIDIGASA
jgi:hypothetical protein